MMKFHIIIYTSLLLLMCMTSASFAQVQKGQNISGVYNGEFTGWDISMPDENTIGVGTYPNNTSGNTNGIARIYSWDGTAWQQKGIDIHGEAPSDYSGSSISMPDSNTIAVGARNNDGAGFNAGHVRIFIWNGNTWIQKGSSLEGEAPEDGFGIEVFMPDSNTFAASAIYNDGNGSSSGNVRIFKWNGSAWVQKGASIYGEAGDDLAGGELFMPDSNTIAITATGNDANGSSSGHVRIFTWSGNSWMQKGNDIDGQAANDHFGSSVSMPDENTIAIGARDNDNNGNDAGQARVYEWNGTAWVQKGSDLYGDNAYDYLGYSISMPSANILAIGAPGYEPNPNTVSNGQVKVFSWDGTTWIQQGSNLVGQYSSGFFGNAISMPNEHTIGIGSYFSSLTQVFNICPASYSSVNVAVCDSLISPSTNHVWTTTGVYLDTLTNAYGCDSIIYVNLTVNSSHITETIYACNSYTWIDGNTYTASNNTASVTYTNALGCDSTINLNLIIQTPFYNLTDTVVACDSYTWANGTTYTGANSVILDTLNSIGGCDSVVTLHLTLLNSTGSTTTAQACNSYTWIDGNTYTASDDSITYVLTNAVGCDSVIRLDLTIDTLIASTDYVNATTLEGSILGDYEHYEWVECQGSQYPSISADSSLIFTPDYNGAYALMVFNDSGCVDTSDCKTITVTGVETIEGEETFTLYPNPTTGDVTVALNQTYSTVSVSVRNTLGQETFAKDYHSTTTIDLELEGNAGIYFIQLKTDDQNHVLKVVKE